VITPGETGSANEPGINLNFTQGQAFTGQTIVNINSFIDSLISRLDYENYTLGKAIAIAENGLGYAALTDGSNSEASRMAVESCNLLTGDSCALIVSGNSFVINRADITSSLTYRLDGLTGGTFSMSAIPMASASRRDTATVRNFINAPGNKALAVSITGGLFSAFTTTSSLTVADVSRMAVQRCELESAVTPCILYAVNTRVEFNPRAWLKRSSIDFANNNVLAVPPPASRSGSLTSIQTLLNETAQQQRYGIAITPNGFGYFGRHATSTDSARQAALDLCEAGVHGSRCILYASSAGVDIAPIATIAKRDFSTLFCRTVRSSCAEHLALGCNTRGQYWVQDTTTSRAVLATCGQ
jgi:hypothetical protein